MEIAGGVFIVTGSATGLGAAVAQRLAGKGGNVVINYTKSEAEAQATAEACRSRGGAAILCQADVSVDEDCRRMAAEALERWGRIDGLVNNAATSVIVPHHDLEGLSSDDFRRILSVNVVGGVPDGAGGDAGECRRRAGAPSSTSHRVRGSAGRAVPSPTRRPRRR